MKGLLYKEWLLERKTILCFLSIAALFSLLGFLVFLSTICGNLQSWREETMTMKVYAQVFFFTPYLILLFALSAAVNSICRDYGAKWMKFCYTFPLKASEAVGIKYLMSILILAGAFLYGVGNGFMISAISGEKFSVEVLKNMFFALLAAFMLMALFLPIAMKVRETRMVAAVAGLLLTLIYLTYGILFMYYTTTYGEEILKSFPDTYRKVRDAVVLLSPVLILGVGGLSFLISVKIYQRRAG